MERCVARLFLHRFVTFIWPFLPTYCFSSLPFFLSRFIFLKWSHLTKSTAPVQRVVTMFVCLFVCFNGALNGLSTRQRQYLKCDTARFPASQHICRSYCICDCKGIWEPQPVSSWCNLVWSGNQGRAGVLGTLSPRKLRQPELAIGTFVEPGQGHSWKPLMEIGALKWWKKKIH